VSIVPMVTCPARRNRLKEAAAERFVRITMPQDLTDVSALRAACADRNPVAAVVPDMPCAFSTVQEAVGDMCAIKKLKHAPRLLLR
jgi:hypothetical protein